jgi:BirA family biotin operon repressor/biotin-[acetyl-CoA-carboxylase] ligase
MQLPQSIDPDRENLPSWLHWVDSCPSTNTWSMEHAAQLEHGDVVFTRRQISGRGQHGRVWHAPPGVLTASFVLDRLKATQLPGLSLAAGLAVIYAVEDLIPDCQGVLRLKWPNDVLLNQRKLAGILCETASGHRSDYTRVIVGVGLNRCADFAQAGLDSHSVANAVSLHQVSSLVPDELQLLERLRHYLIQVAGIFSRTDIPAEKSGLAALLPELRCRDALLNRDIILDLAEETISGQAVGIDACGRLLLYMMSNNEVRAFASGRVRWDVLSL